MLVVALTVTAPLWPPLQRAYRWIWRVAHILGEDGPGTAAGAKRQLGALLGGMMGQRRLLGKLASGVVHFVRVTRSYWPGLFHCYEVPDLPRTNNDLEQFFGRHRYHERRATGRKGASPSLVLRGEVRVLAAAATRQHRYSAAELAQADVGRCAALRERLESRRQRRVSRTRFRRDPQKFLQELEAKLAQSALPS